LAVLKLANKDFSQITHYLECATNDYRDVLMWAEYERYSRLEFNASIQEKSDAIKMDFADYEKWLSAS